MKESSVWWKECGAGLDMQTEYEGEQEVVGRVWSRAGNAARHSMKEGRVRWEECGAGLEMQTGYEGEQGVAGRVWSRAEYADRV